MGFRMRMVIPPILAAKTDDRLIVKHRVVIVQYASISGTDSQSGPFGKSQLKVSAAMTPKIYLALTHDWELRGDGSGDIEQIQFAPLQKLLEIYRKHKARTTFLPDVLQQIRFRQLQTEHSDLESLVGQWDEHVREAFGQGHDIQLHVHPQWHDGRYEDGRWRLNGDWSLLNYDRDDAYALLAAGKDYLEKLLRPIDPSYRCVAFRSGALAAAPSDHLFESLISLGIHLDVSIAGGLFVDNAALQIDYRNCEEDFLPFYPAIKDARRVSGARERIVCVPLNHFYGSRRAVTRQNIALARQRLSRRAIASQATSSQAGAQSEHQSRTALAFEKIIMPAVKRKYLVSDLSRLNYRLMQEMLGSIRQRARQSGLRQLPVILTNHPKDIRDLAGIERFVGEASRAKDISFITLTEVAEKLQNGEFEIRLSEKV